MTDFITPLSPEYTIFLPENPIIWFFYSVWLLLIFICLIVFRDRKVSFDRRYLSWLAVLSALVLMLTPFFGVRLFPNSTEQMFNLPINHLMFFAAVPWMVAAGVLGLVPGCLIAGISGILLAYLDTHQLSTPLLLMTLSVIFSLVIRQNREERIARVLGFPAFGAIITWMISTPVVFVSMLFSAPGLMGLRFAAAYEKFPSLFLTLGGMILFGGVAVTLARLFLPEFSHAAKPVELPEKKFPLLRLVAKLSLLFIVLSTIFVTSVWRISENTARNILVEQLTDSAEVAAEGLALLINFGESQVQDLALNTDLAVQDPDSLEQVLAQESASQSYFDLMAVFTLQGSLISSHPQQQDEMILPTPEEILAIEKASFEDSPILLPVPPIQGGQAAYISFIFPLQDSAGQSDRVLIARTQLDRNPIAVPFMKSLKNLEDNHGLVQIIDDQGRRVYHTNPDLVMSEYTSPRFATTTFFESTTVDDQTMMMFYYPADQAGWAVITAFPREFRHLVAWEIANPLLLVGLSGILILLLSVFLLVSPLTRELGQLKSGIRSLIDEHLPYLGPARGGLGKGRQIRYEEIFTKTFSALNRRIQQQRDLLTIAGPKSTTSDLKQDLTQVMKAALAQGVSSVRILLREDDNPPGFGLGQDPLGLGRDTRLFASLDQQVYSLVKAKGPLNLRDFQLSKQLALPEGTHSPAFLVAFPLSSSKKWFGVFWVTFSGKHDPGQEEVEFLRLLSTKASEILTNHALVEEISSLQKRMEKTLDEFPQAILLTDEAGKIIYHNRFFAEMIDAPYQGLVGRDLIKIFKESHLAELASAVEKGGGDREIRLANGNVLRFEARPIDVKGRRSGSAFLFEPLKGISAKLDSSTELVTIVSHALRSPLTLIHGYAKILRLTGNLNDQQDDYIVKIINGIEEMRSLVQNLLDIGRLEALGVMDFSEFQISQVLQKIKDSMEAQFRQKNVKLITVMPDDPLTIRADFSLLTQALKNLVENALKFTKMGGQVSLKVSDENNRVVFAVKDTGPGIAPLDQHHLFEKFQYGRSVTDAESVGSGLGLAIVRSIVEHHGGRVWLESQLGQGSTFFIEIPK